MRDATATNESLSLIRQCHPCVKPQGGRQHNAGDTAVVGHYLVLAGVPLLGKAVTFWMRLPRVFRELCQAGFGEMHANEQ